jgi:hypothetical protein
MKTFIQWLIDYEDDFEGMTKEEIIETIKETQNILLSDDERLYMGRHYGDCVKQNVSCQICIYQNYLDNYEKYCRSII